MNGFKIFFWVMVICVVVGFLASRCDLPENKECSITGHGYSECTIR